MDFVALAKDYNARPLVAAVVLFLLARYLLRTSIAKRLWAKLEDTIFSSWHRVRDDDGQWHDYFE